MVAPLEREGKYERKAKQASRSAAAEQVLLDVGITAPPHHIIEQVMMDVDGS
jgi:hypothetical protein